MAATKLKISGMTCGHCVRTVTEVLESLEGVKRAAVDLDSGSALVEHDEAEVAPTELAAAVAEEGYEAEEVA